MRRFVLKYIALLALALAGGATLVYAAIYLKQRYTTSPTTVVMFAVVATAVAVFLLLRQSHYSVYAVQLAALLWAAAVSHLGPHWVAEWLLWGGQVAILLILLIRVGSIMASKRKKENS